ncbi:glycoside hydrolase family 19 protein [Variovorax sp. KBS0712]|uniref:glycoside hydrolase family 19 protein n=1 Tax=Variovorax sp. KBS0712 TaxID=2578111 RepID=UPI001C8F8194|nr:glycoside hydrolase family 19 protein [Variovorax sp. KBS0712]
MDAKTLARCTGARIDRAQRFAEPLSAAMAEFGIDTAGRQAAFLANVGHESGGLHWVVELWGPTIAQQRYEGRRDIGNTQPGDGFRFRGRGLLQTTGRANYAALSKALGVDYVADPDRLALPIDAARSAGYFWQSKGLSAFADAGDFLTVVKRINGGFNGLSERQMLWADAKAALGLK